MITRYGDMFTKLYDNDELFLVTGNSYIRKDGALVMGRGAAAQLKRAIPNIAWTLAKNIEHLGEYNLEITSDYIGIFQVKYHFRDNADLDLIYRSAEALADWMKSNPGVKVHMNYPGIGWGHLTPNAVEPYLRPLVDLPVSVWRFARENTRPNS